MSDNLAKVKELRELTGAGIQDCKTALSENNFDIEKSIEYLRKKGITKAAKKSPRDAAEGLAVIASNNSKTCILEINSETDFVAKNKEFINFCSEVSKIALANNFSIETILNALDTVNLLRGVSFLWKSNGLKSYGVIAQELEKIIPDLVTTDANGRKTVNYNALIGFLIEAIKTQSTQIQSLEERITRLEEK